MRRDIMAAAFLAVVALGAGVCAQGPDIAPTVDLIEPPSDQAPVPDPEQVGGEDGSVVHVANLIYAGTKTSKCFSDHFLRKAETVSEISTSHRLHAVKLSSDDVFQYPFVIMTGEGSFRLTDAERANLRKYCERGGFLLASAGCSSKEWDKSFQREINSIWPDVGLQTIPFDHPVFHTVHDIKTIRVKSGKPNPLKGLSVDGKLAVVYSVDGLNDTEHTSGCCCCGGNEILNSEQLNINILAYALTF
jgi:hypothetical protein